MSTLDSQPLLVNRIPKGEGTAQDVSQAKENYERWIREEWNGADALALAACDNALAAAYEARMAGASWTAVPQDDAVTHIWLFSFLCPRRETVLDQAFEYLSGLFRNDMFTTVARRARFVRGL